MSSFNLPIDFCTPIIPALGSSVSGIKKMLYASEWLLSRGRHVYDLGSDGTLTLTERIPSSRRENVLKVVLLCTVIIPLFALVIKSLYRSCGNYNHSSINLNPSLNLKRELERKESMESLLLSDTKKREIEDLADRHRRNGLSTEEYLRHPSIKEFTSKSQTLAMTLAPYQSALKEMEKTQKYLKYVSDLHPYSAAAASFVSAEDDAKSKGLFIQMRTRGPTTTDLGNKVIWVKPGAQLGHLCIIFKKAFGRDIISAIHTGRRLAFDTDIGSLQRESTITATVDNN